MKFKKFNEWVKFTKFNEWVNFTKLNELVKFNPLVQSVQYIISTFDQKFNPQKKKKNLWPSRLWVGRRKWEFILSYVARNYEK